MPSTPSRTPEAPIPSALNPFGAAQRDTLLDLALIDGLRGDALRRLLEAFGQLDDVCRQPWRRLAEVLPAALAGRLRAGADPERRAMALGWAAQPGNSLLLICDTDYPARLRELADPPLLLWLKGNPALLHHPALAMVGSRRATPQGLQDARAFARHLGEAGLTILSGLAEGIDGAAHEGALGTLGSTIAVLAHGLDRLYPPMHRALAHRIAAEGVLVSEYPLGSPALRHHFPERNRLISGLSLGVLVIEAGLPSGSLVTARHALEQGREVMALPGSIHAPLSKGGHQLIREGASLVESAQHVWQQLGGALGGFRSGAEPPPPSPLRRPDDAIWLHALDGGPASIDQLAEAIGLTAEQLSSILGREELHGRVARLPDGRYQRLALTPAATPPVGKDS